jgi:hypothetical protein
MRTSAHASDPTVFRSALMPLLRATIGIGVPLAAIGCLLVAFPHGISDWIALSVLLLVQIFAYWIVMAQFIRIFPLRVAPEGLYGQTSLGLPCFLSWAEMEKVHPVPLTGKLDVPYIFIRIGGRKPRGLSAPRGYPDESRVRVPAFCG